MLNWALFFAICTVVASTVGFTGAATEAGEVWQALVLLFLPLCLLCILLAMSGHDRLRP